MLKFNKSPTKWWNWQQKKLKDKKKCKNILT